MCTIPVGRSVKKELPVGIGVGNTLVTAMREKVEVSTTSTKNLTARCLKQVLSWCVAEGVVLLNTTVKLVEGLLTVFCARLHTKKKFTRKNMLRLCRSFTITAKNINSMHDEEDGDLRFLKTHFQILQNKAFGSPGAPERPELPLFSGWARLFVMRSLARRDTGFIQSLAYTKKVWRDLGASRLREALTDHRKYFCDREPKNLPKWQAQVIKATAFEILSKNLGPPTKLLPTGSACLQLPRSFGGTTGLFTEPDLERVTDLDSPWDMQDVAQTIRQEWYDEAQAHMRSEKCGRGHDCSHLDVQVIAIPEPGKFRVITKGCGYMNIVLQPAQGQLIAAWKLYHANTMSRDPDIEVQRILDNTIGEEGWKWISVDYTSATDLLEIQSTLCAIEACYGLVDHELCIWSLGSGGRVKYDMADIKDHQDDELPEEWRGVQHRTNGQPMGHPLSFPLLCVINEAAVRMTCKVCVRDGIITEEQAVKIANNHLVNGDDLLLRGPPAFNQIFIEISTSIGLVYNVDKSFVSDHSALINSQLYRQSGTKMRRIGVLNLRIVEGNKDSTPDEQAFKLNEMFNQAHWTQGCLPIAMEHWNGRWKGSFQPNWFLPVNLGGYGITPRVANDTVKWTYHQRKMAARQIQDPTIALWKKSTFFMYKKSRNEKVELSVLKSKYIPKWRLSHDDEYDQDPNANAWEERIMYFEKIFYNFDEGLIHTGLYDKDGDPRLFTKKKIQRPPTVNRMCQQMVKRTHLKPCSSSGMIRWWNARLISDAMPVCPPMNIIHCAETTPWKEWKWQHSHHNRFIRRYGKKHFLRDSYHTETIELDETPEELHEFIRYFERRYKPIRNIPNQFKFDPNCPRLTYEQREECCRSIIMSTIDGLKIQNHQEVC